MSKPLFRAYYHSRDIEPTIRATFSVPLPLESIEDFSAGISMAYHEKYIGHCIDPFPSEAYLISGGVVKLRSDTLCPADILIEHEEADGPERIATTLGLTALAQSSPLSKSRPESATRAGSCAHH
jgi:hypothetical protein